MKEADLNYLSKKYEDGWSLDQVENKADTWNVDTHKWEKPNPKFSSKELEDVSKNIDAILNDPMFKQHESAIDKKMHELLNKGGK